MGRRTSSDLLRGAPADLLAHVDPDDPRLEGQLYEAQDVEPITADELRDARERELFGPRPGSDAELRELLYRHRRARVSQQISGFGLCSQAATPFVLDGVTYPSVQRFYDALKVPDDERRARFVAGATQQEVGVGRGRADAEVEYGGERFPVGSRPHLQLIARAVSAKVAAHPQVVAELRATGRRRLYMGPRGGQALGRAMPFALMVERLHL